MLKNISKHIQENTDKGEITSPFLFLGGSAGSIHLEIQEIISELQEAYGLPSSYIFYLEDDEKSLKIENIRSFIAKSHNKPDYKIQIFVIENISRMTLASSHSMLKFLEEPALGNIIFLTNKSRSGILPTILSRVSMYDISSPASEIVQNTKYIEEMIYNYVESDNTEILSYYFSKQIDQRDASDFLYSLLVYIKKTGKKKQLLAEIEKDINALMNNNSIGKYIIDSYFIKLKRL